MVEKEFVTMDEDTIIIDAVKVMRDTVYLLYSLQNQVQERPFYFIWEFSRTKEHFIRLYQCGELVKSALCFI
jgi:hypothetical protein